MSASSRHSSAPTGTLARTGIAAYLLVLAILVTWPVTPRLANGSLAHQAESDLLLSQYLILWGAHAITSPDAELAHTNMFHPERHTYGYSDMPVSHSLLALPLLAAGATPDQMYGAFVLLSLWLGGLGMVALTRRIGLSMTAALGAATIHIANPAHLGRYVNPQLFGDHWLPWLLWALLGWLAAAGLRRPTGVDEVRASPLPEVAGRAVLLAVLLVLHALSGSHNAVFGALLGGAIVLWHLIVRRSELFTRPRMRTAFALSATIVVVVAVACLLPVFRTYLAVYDELVAGRMGDPAIRAQVLEGGSAGLRELLSGASDWWTRVEQRTGWPGEWIGAGRRLRAHLFPGAVPLLLAGVGLLGLAPRRTLAARQATVLTVDIVQLSLLAMAAPLALGRPYPGWLPSAGWIALGAAFLFWLRARIDTASPHVIPVAARALRRAWRRGPDLLLVAGVWLLMVSLTPGPGSPTYELLSRIPGVSLIRVPSRFWLPALVLLACLAGAGIDRIRRRPGGLAIVAVLGALFLAEAEMIPLRIHPVPYPTDAETEWLAEQPGEGAIAEFPIRLTPPAAARQMIRSTEHWKPLLVGYSGSEPPGYRERMLQLQSDFPEPSAIETLRRLGVEWVIVDSRGYEPDALPAIRATDALVPEARFGPREIFRLR